MTHFSVAEITNPLPGNGMIDHAFLDAAQWRRRIRDVVARRIMPSVAARHRGRPMIPQGAITAFASLLVTAPLAAAIAMVEGHLEGGTGFEDVMLLLFAPAARVLGDLWQADRMSFLDVTRGASTLQGLIRHFGPDYEAGGPPMRHGRAILLAPVPGEQHVLGLCMLATAFRRAGWHVVFDPRAGAAETLQRVGTEPFDAVGLSASCTRTASRLPAFAAEVRAATARRDLRIVAGGAFASESMAAGVAVGVDGIAADVSEAIALVERLVPTAAHLR